MRFVVDRALAAATASATLAALLALGGCTRETLHAVVVAHVSGLDPSAVALRVTATLDGTQVAAPLLYTPAVSDLALLLPDGTTGALRVDATALDANETGIARGGAGVNVPGIGEWPASIALSTAGADRTLLLDRFDDGDPGTNTAASGIGTGFLAVGYDESSNPVGATASESGGTITIGGPGAQSALVSHDGFNPVGTVITAVVATRPGGVNADSGANGVSFGWTRPGVMPCCDDDAYLDLTDDRIALDVGTTSSFDPLGRYVQIAGGSLAANAVFDTAASTHDLTLVLRFGPTDWRCDATGPGLDVHQSGAYRPGFTPADAATVAGGTMRPFLGAGREHFSAVYRSITVVGPPPGVTP